MGANQARDLERQSERGGWQDREAFRKKIGITPEAVTRLINKGSLVVKGSKVCWE